MFARIRNLFGHIGFGDLVKEGQAAAGQPDLRLFEVHAHKLHVVILASVLEPRGDLPLPRGSSLAFGEQ